MKNIFIFAIYTLMCNITFANCVNYKELKGIISQNAHKLVKTNGKYIGFLLEDNAKIISFDLVKLINEQTKINAYTLNNYINIDIKSKDNKLEGLVEIIYFDDNAFTSTISLEINDDIQILSSKKISQIRKDKVKLQKFTLFYINISDLKNSHNIGIPKNPVNCKLLD